MLEIRGYFPKKRLGVTLNYFIIAYVYNLLKKKDLMTTMIRVAGLMVECFNFSRIFFYGFLF